LKAWLLLTVAMLKSLLRRAFGNAGGIAAFRHNYDADGLPPVTAAERAELPTFSRCLACGICDRGEGERIAASGGAYRGVMPLMLSASRSMPDFRAAAYSLREHEQTGSREGGKGERGRARTHFSFGETEQEMFSFWKSGKLTGSFLNWLFAHPKKSSRLPAFL
jgi:hypothetical protein